MEWNRKLISALLALCLVCGLAQPALAAGPSAEELEAYYGPAAYQDIAVSIYARMLLYKDGRGVIAVKDGGGKYGLVDLTGKTVAPFEYQGIWLLGKGLFKFRDAQDRWGVINDEGKVLVRLDGGSYESVTCSNNVVQVITYVPGQNPWNGTYHYDYYHLDWTRATEQEYYKGTWQELYGRSAARAADADGVDYYAFAPAAWGVRSAAGGRDYEGPSFAEEYDSCWSREKDYVVSKNGKWGVVDENNRVLVPLKYDDSEKIGQANQQGYIAVETGEYSSDLYKDGSLVKSFSDRWVGTAVYYRDLAFSTDGKQSYGIMKLDGTTLLAAKYSRIITDWNGNLLTCALKAGSGWEELYGLYTYDGVTLFEDGYSTLSYKGGDGYILGRDGKYGAGTVNGGASEITVPIECEDVRYFGYHVTEFRKDGQYAVFSLDGTQSTAWSGDIVRYFASELLNMEDSWYDSYLEDGYLYGEPESFLDADAFDGAYTPRGCMPYMVKVPNGWRTYYLNHKTGETLGYLPVRASNINSDGRFIYRDGSGKYGLGMLASALERPEGGEGPAVILGPDSGGVTVVRCADAPPSGAVAFAVNQDGGRAGDVALGKVSGDTVRIEGHPKPGCRIFFLDPNTFQPLAKPVLVTK